VTTPADPWRGAFRMPLRLETGRMCLRPFVDDDWAALHEYFGDAEATRFTYRRAMSESASWRAVATMAGQWLLRGCGPYAVELKEGGVVVGTVGPWQPLEWPELEIKWALARRHWGRGYAAEAVREVQRAMREHLGGPPPISLIDAANRDSIRLALRVGAVLEREIEFAGGPFHVYRHPAGEIVAGPRE